MTQGIREFTVSRRPPVRLGLEWIQMLIVGSIDQSAGE